MIYYIDIDNTICITKNSDYKYSQPVYKRINFINNLYDKGHTIVYWTARGSSSGLDWSEFTKLQLNEWGCKRHDILFKKPHYDIYIDDKSINSESFFND